MFYSRNRNVGENIKSYVAELRRLSEYCNFGNKLNEHLRDKLVCGLNDQRIQQRLLATKNLDLNTAIDISIAMEVAARNARDLHGTILNDNQNVNGGEGGSSRIHKLLHQVQEGLMKVCSQVGESVLGVVASDIWLMSLS